MNPDEIMDQAEDMMAGMFEEPENGGEEKND